MPRCAGDGDVGRQVGHAARRLDGRPQPLDASLEVRGRALALVVDGLRQHDVAPGHRRVHERRDRDHVAQLRRAPSASGRPPATRPSGRRRSAPAPARCRPRSRPAPRRRRRRGRRGGRRARSAPVGRGSTPPRSCRPRACAAAAIAAMSTPSVTISTGMRRGGRAGRDRGRARRAPARSWRRPVWRDGAGVALEQRAAGADDHQVRAAPARLADAQVEHAAAIGHVGVAHDHDHVGPVEVVDARRVRVEQLPRAVGCDRAGRRQRAHVAGDAAPGVGLLVGEVAAGDDGHRAGAAERRRRGAGAVRWCASPRPTRRRRARLGAHAAARSGGRRAARSGRTGRGRRASPRPPRGGCATARARRGPRAPWPTCCSRRRSRRTRTAR